MFHTVVNRLTKDEVLRWLPRGPYYQEHADRLFYSFAQLPPLPAGFSCLVLGSNGAEVPLLVEKLGAGRVVCCQAPYEGLPPTQRLTVQAPDNLGRPHEVEVFNVNLERDPLPEGLGEFDLVLMWEILEHLCFDPPALVWQGIRAARVGGTVCLTTPNAFWHVYTTAHLGGNNALGLRLQLHQPFATHWRLYSPAEVRELFERMGCQVPTLTTFINAEPFSFKSRLFHWWLEWMRRGTGNGTCSLGQHIYAVATKTGTADVCRPEWLNPTHAARYRT
jgi:hypothetical protein